MSITHKLKTCGLVTKSMDYLKKVMEDDKLKQSFLDYIRGNATEEDINNFINRFKRDEK